MTVYDKTKKYDGMVFFKRPKDTLNYLYLDKVNASTLLIYDLLCDYYNSEKGYAYPSMDTLALDSGMTRQAVGTHVKVLHEYGLVKIFVEKRKGNKKGEGYKYKPQLPLSREELFKRYPEARKRYEKKANKIKDRYEKPEIVEVKIGDIRF
ncbi:helix-turn-helix domain-containing protein [Fictibacillus sp. Mic-4]|uniref:helix-turn-helix domain-containing protein n=1 Tax=Fictibacillus sp. Mic-4 TaxID=3132826 RepID=UPI003CEF0F3D